MHHVYKNYDGVKALTDTHFDLCKGEVHALIGENGAGKTTLIKIIMGVIMADSGVIKLDGNPVHIHNPQSAQEFGIAAIYQEPMVFPDLNVAENIFISHADRGSIVHWRKTFQDAEDVLSKLDVNLNVHMPARGLTLAAQQTVEIAKAISLNARILIMDEPTSSLSAHEVKQLFKIVRSLRDQGVSILFIGHRLEEVLEIADRITVFRDGRWISSKPRDEVTIEGLIHDMVGRDVKEFFAKEKTERGELLMSVRNLYKENVFKGINFDVYRGEVLGFAGLIGSGRTDVGLALFGIEHADSGDIIFEGKKLKIKSSQQALEHGIAYSTEDRRRLGLIMPMSICSNITLPLLQRYLNSLGLIKKRPEEETAESFRKQLDIHTSSVQTVIEELSGGNQQKVMISKWLNADPKLLILDEPTRGIDVATKAEVHNMINDLASQGVAVILISSDLPEVLAMSDRILVMHEGNQMGIFDQVEAEEENIMATALGQNQAIQETVQ
ncbi:MAG TPA: sugar ABC transporter ATP-binding protein [Anaerolineae bacterium]|nr:sugar ABC transporter ATP-binding protein [Anaerolineae bacterium]